MVDNDESSRGNDKALNVPPLKSGEALRPLGASGTSLLGASQSAPLPPDNYRGWEERLQAIRVYVQDCIENGHDRAALANLYGARDEIDALSVILSRHGDALMTADEMLKMMPLDMLLATARNALSPAFVEKTPATIEETMDALAKQARVSMAVIAALAGRRG